MRKGEPVEGLQFYQLLYQDNNFCMELGRAILAAGRLESALTHYLNSHASDQKAMDASLGRLITFAKKRQLLTQMIPVLEMLRDQRNYLTHNLHALFTGLIEETILSKSDLLDSDVDTFTERAYQLKENLNGLANILANPAHISSPRRAQ